MTTMRPQSLFERQAALKLATVTGILAILLMLCMQMSSESFLQADTTSRDVDLPSHSPSQDINPQTEPFPEYTSAPVPDPIDLPADDLADDSNDFLLDDAADHSGHGHVAEAVDDATDDVVIGTFDEPGDEQLSPTSAEPVDEPAPGPTDELGNDFAFDDVPEPVDAPLLDEPEPETSVTDTKPEIGLELEWIDVENSPDSEVVAAQAAEEDVTITVSSDDNPNEPLVDSEEELETQDDDWLASESRNRSSLPNPTLTRSRDNDWQIDAPHPTAEILADTPGELEPSSELKVSIEKTAPVDSSIHDSLNYQIVVRNDGDEAVKQLQVEERMSAGVQVTLASPKAVYKNDTLRWQMEQLDPGDEETLEVQLLANSSGVVQGITSVNPLAAVATTTTVQSPKLRVELSLPNSVRAKQRCAIVFHVANDGSAAAEGVLLKAELSDRLTHPKGSALEIDLGTLPPGESRAVRLNVVALRSGPATIKAGLADDAISSTNAEAAIDVGPPRPSPHPATKPTGQLYYLPCCRF